VTVSRRLARAAGSAATTNVNTLLVPPPGAVLTTATPTLRAVETSAALIAARSSVLLTKVVGRASPFQCATELDTNPVRAAVSVNPAPPATTLVGDTDVSEGTGLPGCLSLSLPSKHPGKIPRVEIRNSRKYWRPTAAVGVDAPYRSTALLGVARPTQKTPVEPTSCNHHAALYAGQIPSAKATSRSWALLETASLALACGHDTSARHPPGVITLIVAGAGSSSSSAPHSTR
jgi:hypothetical protein